LSRIPDLGQALEHLPELLNSYEQELVAVEKIMPVEGKLLEKANLEQASYPLYYDMKRKELRTILKYVEMRREKVRGQLFKSYTETYSRDLSDRAKEKYIDNESEYLKYNELYLEIEELYEKFNSVIDSFERRGFALRNITELRVNSLENTQV